MVAVDITKSNFEEVMPAVKQALERCTFFAVDCEMTGLHTDGAKNEYLDDHQARSAAAAPLCLHQRYFKS
jgi:poly(A)-specific ribonuclease